MRPILKYRGGKRKEIDKFNEFIPNKFATYYEPFLGGGSVYFYLEPEHAVISDINKNLIDFYKGIKYDFKNVHNELLVLGEEYKENRLLYEYEKFHTPNVKIKDKNEILYYHIRDMFNKKIPAEYKFATIYFYINKTAYSGMIRYNKNGEFNVPYGRYKNFNVNLLTTNHHRLLENAEIKNCDYSVSFKEAEKNDFMFLDPPYDTTFSEYGNEVFTGDFVEDNHRQLAEDFKNLSCKALMIIGETELTRELYDGYIKGVYAKKYSVNIRNRFKSQANHLIITNY